MAWLDLSLGIVAALWIWAIVRAFDRGRSALGWTIAVGGVVAAAWAMLLIFAIAIDNAPERFRDATPLDWFRIMLAIIPGGGVAWLVGRALWLPPISGSRANRRASNGRTPE